MSGHNIVQNHTCYVFLDVDGVLNRYGLFHTSSKLGIEKALVAELNLLLSIWSTHTYRIVFNTAWNIHTMDYMRATLAAAGFKHPKYLHDQTSSTAGGGGPVRQYILDHNLIGEPFIIIDDSTHDYGEMWCRLLHIDGTKGLTKATRQQAGDLIWRACSPHENRDRKQAVNGLMAECWRLANHTPWLDPSQREKEIRLTLDLMAHCLTVPDFLGAAFLSPPAKDGSPQD